MRRWYTHMWVYVLAVLFALGLVVTFQYRLDLRKAYERLNSYNVETIDTDYGKMSYVDEGSGEALLISHGIFGGYDQALISLRGLVGDKYRKIAPSRFGYPGSDMPSYPTPENQAKAFLSLLGHLGVHKTYVIATSAGGAAGIRFAIEYPDRVKGLILLSSGVPVAKKTREEITGPTGPPVLLVNNFPIWLATKYFGWVFKSMFASDVDDSMLETMLPVKPRRKGIRADETITNLDMDINFDDYPVDRITAPILVIHAKDDPMVKYEGIEKFIARTGARTRVFETGGHLITGHGDAVSEAVEQFIEETKQ